MIYIGKEEVQLSSVTEDGVALYNGTLFPVELPLDVFVRRVKENPLNEHLTVKVETSNEMSSDDSEKRLGDDMEIVSADLEAERSINEHEAEFGADGYRAFLGNRPEQENCESLSIWQRYEQEKQLYPEAVAAIRVGDFYEFFAEDAKRVAKLIDLPLTTRQIDGADRVPMCGIPFHATEKYFSKLLDAGIRIAIDDDDLTPRILLPNTGKQEKRFVVVESEDLSGDPYEEWDGEKNAVYTDENGNKSTFITRWQAEDFASELNRWEYEKTHDRSGELFYEDSEPESAPQEYDLEFGYLGNGLTVWNRLQEEHGDYKTIAHIGSDRTVRFYDQNIPESIKKRIYEVAATSDGRISASQDIPVFSTPPKLDRIPLQEDASEVRETIPQFAEEPKPRKTFPVYNSHSEIPDSEKHNYRITDNEIGMGGAKEKFRKNITAINLLHELEFDNRLATPEEQEILAKYSGWGGLADAFDETKDNWSKEFTELYTTLSPEEYRAAEESTLTAFYTPPVVIKAMYKALENMGFKRGNILEPSCGVGNFMGLVPENMDVKMYGVELDSLSGRIARQLYCYARGFDWGGLYEIFHRVSCWCCPLQDLSELRKLYEHFPELWTQLRRWDDSTWRQFRKDYSVRELEIRFALEKEYISNGKSLRNKEFYRALKQRIADNRVVIA